MIKEKEYFCTGKIRGSLLMVSRRLLRIKALIALYAFNRREDDDLARAETELMFSIGKTYDLYHYLMLLVLDVADLASEKIEHSLRKKMPAPEDLNPNRRFIDNRVISQLRSNLSFKKYISVSKLSWINYLHIPRLFYGKMTSWETYLEYMNSGENDYQSDKKFIIRLITELFSNSEELLNCLEEQSIYWNDDMEFVLVMVEKTLKKFKSGPGDKIQLMPLFKNEEDS
jgi:N utilization substance protein B